MGRVALGALALAVAIPAGAAATDGPRLFQRCYACHSVEAAERHLPGPTLHGLFGRRAGALPEFDYSAALRAAGRRGLVWSEQTLHRFLADPEEAVPGGRMTGVRVADPAEREALIRWLRRATR